MPRVDDLHIRDIPFKKATRQVALTGRSDIGFLILQFKFSQFFTRLIVVCMYRTDEARVE